jgi:hypothetical protein
LEMTFALNRNPTDYRRSQHKYKHTLDYHGTYRRRGHEMPIDPDHHGCFESHADSRHELAVDDPVVNTTDRLATEC